MNKINLSGLCLLTLVCSCAPEARQQQALSSTSAADSRPVEVPELSSEQIFLVEAFASIQDWARKYLALRIGGTEVLPEMPISTLSPYYAPRRKVPVPGLLPVTDPDPLYKPSERGVLTVPWRDYLLYPNSNPYFANHVLLIGNERQTQNLMHETPQTLNDIMYLHEAVPTRTFFFNHLAGNSQPHFHLQTSTDHFPVENRLIKWRSEGSLGTIADFRDYSGVSVESFNNGSCMAGILVSGPAAKNAAAVHSILNRLMCMGFYYNLIFLPLERDNHQVLIFVRWKEEIRLLTPSEAFDIPDIIKLEIGSSELGGYMAISNPVAFSRAQTTRDLPFVNLAKLDEALRFVCDKSLLDPEDLGVFATVSPQCRIAS